MLLGAKQIVLCSPGATTLQPVLCKSWFSKKLGKSLVQYWSKAGLDRYICVLVGKETARRRGGSPDRHRVHTQEIVVETQSKNLPHSICVSGVLSLGMDPPALHLSSQTERYWKLVQPCESFLGTFLSFKP